MKVTKKAVKEFVQQKLACDDVWATKALLRIYAMQTEEEKSDRQTVNRNGVGFGIYDADVLTGLAKWYKDKKFFSPKQLGILHKKMPRYWKQIIMVSDEEKLNNMVSAL